MRVVDTSAWIEALAGTPAGTRVRPELRDLDQWVMPTIVLFELSKWVTQVMGEDAAVVVEAYANNCVVADLGTATAVLAAELSVRHKLATTDAIVYATAQTHNADLVTCDGRFENLPGVRFIPKHDA